MQKNERLSLVKRPGLAFDHDCVALVQDAVPNATDGEFLVQVSHVTLDVAMLGWMREGRSYVPNIALGDTIRATAVGRVIASHHTAYQEGDLVAGLFGAQRFAASDGTGVVKLDASLASAADWAGSLGLTTAFTGYVGMDIAGYELTGKTVLVSGASGLVGGMVAQMAKARGARVVGTAGGPEKCAAVIDDLGIDACIDYRDGPFEAALHAAFPDRVDVFFDNVGGEIFDTTLMWMNEMGRVIMCGQTAERGASSPAVVHNIRAAILERLRIQGFIVFDRTDLYRQAAADIGAAFAAKALIVPHPDILVEDGLAGFADAYLRLVTGQDKGKVILAL